MNYKITRTDKYLKKLIKFLKTHPNLQTKYEKTIELLEINPHHPSLRLHKLQGNLNGFFSISIDLSYRILIDFIIMENEIILLDIGTHDEVY